MGVEPRGALGAACTFAGLTLPEVLPLEPMGRVVEWLNLAAQSRTQPNPQAMTLATVDARGWPSARIVLARGVDAARGFVVFYTNYASRKGAELEAQPRAALCLHWDHLDRQVRIEGPVTRSPAAESDAYFASRARAARVAAWASDQSRPIASRAALLEKNAAAAARFTGAGAEVPRPAHWGGYRVWARRVELWLGNTERLHDRAAWTRELSSAEVDGVAGFVGGPWSATRLQP